MSDRDLTKETLYSGVKSIYDSGSSHIHLPQQKLYTLFSVAFQYMLYTATKEGGHYIIRVEDSYLLDKLIKRSKDQSTRKFMQKLALPRKLKYQNACFHLDFFNISTWANTNDLPKDRIKGAIIVKSTSKKTLDTIVPEEEADQELIAAMESLPSDYYVASLKEFVPKTITIAFDEEYTDLEKINFPFIKETPKEDITKGVKISSDIDLDSLKD